MVYDIVIIGAGPAGLTAAIYAGRAKMKTLVVSEAIPGGQTMMTEEIENYPGFVFPIKGPKLMNDMYGQAKKLDLEFNTSSVHEIVRETECFVIKTDDREIKTTSVILATGASYRQLGAKGEKEFTGRGVSYCGVCDAPLFKNKEIAIIGGGNTAVYEAGYLLKFCSKLHLIHRRDRLRASKIMQKRILENPKVTVHWNSVAEEIYGSNLVEGIKIKDVKSNKTHKVPCKGVFVFVGIAPNSKIAKPLVKTNGKGFIVTDSDMVTSCNGIFACGDIREKELRQIVTAAGDGALAAFSAQQYVEELKGVAYK